MASAGAVAALGQLGAVEALGTVLAHAVNNKACTGAFLLQVAWATVALWRLCVAPANAARALATCASTLLKVLQVSDWLSVPAEAAGFPILWAG